MKKLLLLLLFWYCAVDLSAQTTYSKETLQQIIQVENNVSGRIKIEGESSYILDRMAFYKVKGLSIAVIQNYKVVWAKGYGWADEKEKRPVTPETLFEPGSISKSINAIGVLKLVQDKKLDLYTDINKYLVLWKFRYDSVSHNKKISLANLLSHSAGLTVHGFPGYHRQETIPTLPEILDGKKPANTPAVRSFIEPGLRFQYSGGGTTISQLIVSDVTGQSYDKFIDETLFRPLGMYNTFFTQPPPDGRLTFLATGYHSDGREVSDKFHVYPEQGAAGLWTTPGDLCKYIIETQLAYEGKSAKVLNQEMTKLHLTPYLDRSAALGVFIEERGGVSYFQHGAGNEGFRGQYYGSLTGGNGVAVFVNSDNGEVIPELINSVATVYKWKDFNYTPVTKKPVNVPDEIKQKYAGIYQAVPNTFSHILKNEDGYVQFADGIYSKMYFTGNSSYFVTEFSNEKHFLFGADSSVTGYVRILDGRKLAPHIKLMNIDTLKGSEEFLNDLGWHLIENREYAEATRYLQRALELYPGSLLALGNMAHCYLFTGNYDKAIKIYKAHQKEIIDGNFTWEKMIQDDFKFFKERGFDKEPMNRVFADLKLKIPKGY